MDSLPTVWAVERRPEPDFEVIARGLLVVPVEEPSRPDPVLIEYQLASIDDVCAPSERVCRRLAHEALNGE